MIKESPDEALRLATLVADILGDLDDDVAAADMDGTAPVVSVVMKSGRHYKVTITQITA